MNKMLELPETVLSALEQQAAASGTTPQDWIAARLAEANLAKGPSSPLQPLSPRKDASDNRAPADPIHSGFAEAIEADLRRLAALPNNWDRYEAPPIDPAILAAVAQFVRALPKPIGARPRVVPMSPGNLQLEWHHGQRVLEFEFESPQSIRYLQWDPPAGIEEEDSFPAGDLQRATDLIQWFMTGTGV